MEGPSKGDAREEELRDIVHGLFEEGQRMMRLKPMPAMQDSVRGLGAVTRELCLSARPLSPGELARVAHVSDARIANILKVLEERGVIERRTAKADRRRVEVVVTEKGREEERRRFQEGERFMVDFFSELGVEDAREFVRIFRRINDVMERRRVEGREVPPSPDGCDGGACA